ncbi:MAG: pantoate--beta-alanine ligase [Thermodesulfobacteriota bacterium]|nr:pantoate--beta-alanine ligase [Thermodesulfobacteriota bacterium]
MKVIHKAEEIQKRLERIRSQGKTIVLVPTMGFFHEGHLSLMRKGRELGDYLVISIFVNPSQFGPHEDFESYPRDLERDLQLARKIGVDAVFTPDNMELYPKGFQTYIELEKLPNHLCGLSRPVFFKGIATVVAKLFNIVKPQVAIFGEKDYQQLTVIRRMVRDLNFDIKIVGGPTVREPDGLAMSSRNNYLTPKQRTSALTLYKSLKKAKDLLKNGVKDAGEIIQAATKLITSLPETKIDYISICDPEYLENIKTIDKPALMALAVNVGKTRLIDNMILFP